MIILYHIFLKSLVQTAVSLHKEAKLQEAGTFNNPKDCSGHSNLPTQFPDAHLTHIWGFTLGCGLPLPSPTPLLPPHLKKEALKRQGHYPVSLSVLSVQNDAYHVRVVA